MPQSSRKKKFSTAVEPQPPIAGPRLLGRIWIEDGGLTVMSWSRATLIKRIDETGSITAAARSMGISYAKAWSMVQEMNGYYPAPLVLNRTGGRSGGGATVTAAARAHARGYIALCADFARWLAQRSRRSAPRNRPGRKRLGLSAR